MCGSSWENVQEDNRKHNLKSTIRGSMRGCASQDSKPSAEDLECKSSSDCSRTYDCQFFQHVFN